MKQQFKKIVKNLLENVFLSFLIFFSLAILFGFFVFLKYNPKYLEKKIERIPSFDERTYQKIIDFKIEEKEKLKESENKEKFNIFEEKKENENSTEEEIKAE